MKFYCEIFTIFFVEGAQDTRRRRIRNHFLIDVDTEKEAQKKACIIAFYLSKNHTAATNEVDDFLVSVIPWDEFEKNMIESGKELVDFAKKYAKES